MNPSPDRALPVVVGRARSSGRLGSCLVLVLLSGLPACSSGSPGTSSADAANAGLDGTGGDACCDASDLDLDAGGFDAAPVADAAGGATTSVSRQQLIDDNSLLHELAPVPVVPSTWDWSYHGCPHVNGCPEMGDMGTPGPRSYPADNRDHWNPWAVILPDPSTPENLNAGFEIADITMYIRRKSTGQWTVYNHGPCSVGYIFSGAPALPWVEGSSYAPLPGPGGGIFFKLGWGGFTSDTGIHFWPDHEHEYIPPDDVDHAAVSMTARIVLEDPSGTDDRAQARYLLELGVDHRYVGQDGIISPALNGRFRYLTTEWRTYTGSTLSEAEVNSDVIPPIDGRTW